MPGPADDTSHVAYFTAPRAPEGVTRIEQANATFGWADGKPSLHCHAAWVEPDGQRRGGHILPGDSVVAEATEVEAWGFRTVRVATAPDAETNFTLFQPSGVSTPGTAVFARVKPNEDLVLAVETIAAAHAMRDADVRGSLGSLIGAAFANGTSVADHATEVLVRSGSIRNGIAELDLLVVDMAGKVHSGPLTRGENPVCITFDLVLERVRWPRHHDNFRGPSQSGQCRRNRNTADGSLPGRVRGSRTAERFDLYRQRQSGVFQY